jgi:hypothetical protein
VKAIPCANGQDRSCFAEAQVWEYSDGHIYIEKGLAIQPSGMRDARTDKMLTSPSHLFLPLQQGSASTAIWAGDREWHSEIWVIHLSELVGVVGW